MKLVSITVATNGYVAISEDDWGIESTSIHKNLLDLALFAGESIPILESVVRHESVFQPKKEYVYYDAKLMYPKDRLKDIRHLAKTGQKIEAIKLFRSMFTHSIGLRQAKEIVEIMAGEE